MKLLTNFFLVTFVLLITLSVNSYSEIINKVVADGNKRVTVESIIVFGDIEIGSNYEQKDLSLLIKKLYETNFFSSISATIKSNVLSISVVENPFVNRISFEGEKSKKSLERLRDLLALSEKSSSRKIIFLNLICLSQRFSMYARHARSDSNTCELLNPLQILPEATKLSSAFDWLNERGTA